MKHTTLTVARPIASLFLFLLAWELSTQISKNVLFPSPSIILSSLPGTLTDEFLYTHVIPTVATFSSSFVIGSGLGVVAGGLLGSSPLFYQTLLPHILFIRFLPTAARVSVIMGIFGVGWESLILAVFMSAFLNLFIMTAMGVAKVDTTTKEYCRILGLGRFQEAFRVLVPAATGDIFAALQSTLQSTLVVVILVESLASAQGLGAHLIESQHRFDFVQMWTTMLILGIIGYSSNNALVWFEHRIGKWYFKSKGDSAFDSRRG